VIQNLCTRGLKNFPGVNLRNLRIELRFLDSGHTCASRVVQNGVTVFEVQRLATSRKLEAIRYIPATTVSAFQEEAVLR